MYNIKILDKTDLDDVNKYWELIFNAPSTMTSLEQEFINIYEGNDITLVVEKDSAEFIGCSKVKIMPLMNLFNLDELIELKLYNEDIFYFGGSYVLPEYRGKGILKKLNERRMNILDNPRYIKTRGIDKIYTEILGNGIKGSIHPDSEPAYNSLIKLGFEDTGLYSKDVDKGPILVYYIR